MSPPAEPSRRRTRLSLAAVALAALLARPAVGGWVFERVTHTELAPGPSSKVTTFVSKGKVKELHPDGTYFLWDVPRKRLFQVNPSARSYSGGPVQQMIGSIKRYLDEMREGLAKMSDEEREDLARRMGDVPMPVPKTGVPPAWTVKATGRSRKILGRTAKLFEIHADGRLFEERWIATDLEFGADLDYAEYARWGRALEAAFAAGMGDDLPSGREVEALDAKGLVMRSVLLGEKARVVSDVTSLEKKDLPDSTFALPLDFQLKGAQLSRPQDFGFSGSEISFCLPTTTRMASSGWRYFFATRSTSSLLTELIRPS